LYDLQQPYHEAFSVSTNFIAGNREINGYYSKHWDGTIPEALGWYYPRSISGSSQAYDKNECVLRAVQGQLMIKCWP